MIQTHSLFYYGYTITSENNFFDFSEGGPELTAEIAVGSYTPTDFCIQLKTAMDSAGGLVYTVAFDRDTRQITISSTANFEILTFSGSHAGATPYDIAGLLTGADYTGDDTYTGNESGDFYQTQFYLQDFVSTDDFQQAVESSINKSASGQVEVVKFGTEKFMECNIQLANDISQTTGGILRTNLSGVADLRRLMQFLITKSPFEFVPDENDTNTYEKMLLESTPESTNGVGYKLKEMYDRGLVGYFQTGKLKFRRVES